MVRRGMGLLRMWTLVLSTSCTAFLALAAAGEHHVNADDASAEEESVNSIQIAYAEPFITAETSQFGEKIEGTSVDERGRMYAVHFQRNTAQLGRLSNEQGEVEQRLFFRWTDSTSDFNGIRFLPVPPSQRPTLASMAVVADKKGQVLQVLERRADGAVDGRVFCSDGKMVHPNDVAVSYRYGRVYSSGLDYGDTTVYGDGDHWLCEISTADGPPSTAESSDGPVARATRLNVQGRANGLEISTDERHLYVAETWARNKTIYSNVVWKYDVDNATGRLSSRRLFFDMKDIDEELKGTAGDIDGVRTDMDGNLFLVRNGRPGEVVKVSVGGTVIRRIKLPGITDPTNLELGGPKGTTLFVVGKCTKDVEKGCVDVLEGNEAPGWAFHNLAGQAGRHHDEL